MSSNEKIAFDPSQPYEAVDQKDNPDPNQKVPFDPSLPFTKIDNSKYGTVGQQLGTGIEQGLSGATLGLSKVFETRVLSKLSPEFSSEAVEGRARENPTIALGSNVLGTLGSFAATGGLTGLLGKGAGVAARIGAGSLEGAGISGINQATDDWSKNNPLDAQKIAASAGMGALLGGALTGIGEGIKYKFGTPLAKGTTEGAEKVAQEATEASQPIMDAPQVKGVKATSLKDIEDRVQSSIANNQSIPLPGLSELDGALSRVETLNPVSPLQRDSLSSQQARDIYQTAKETPGNVGSTLSNYEAVQKGEFVGKTHQTIQDIAPKQTLTPDAYKGGDYAIDAFTQKYQAEKAELGPILNEIKKLPVSGDLLPDAVVRMTEVVPGISNMFEVGDGLTVRPYRTSWGIDKATYNAVKEVAQSLAEEESPNLKTLWNVRKGLDQHIDTSAQGQAPSEIRSIKAALMDQMQDSSGNPNIREFFKRYAINEEQAKVIDKAFGASVGSPELGQLSKVKRELVGDKIFANTATVDAAKNILPKEKFNVVLGNWISEAVAKATDKGAFSSNKFGSFLKNNQDALNIAFKDKPAQLQRLKDLVTIMRILPDSGSVNPSGTAKAVSRMIHDVLETKLHNASVEGLLSAIPQKIGKEIVNKLKMNELNSFLSGEAVKTSQSQLLKDRVIKYSNHINRGVEAIFSQDNKK